MTQPSPALVDSARAYATLRAGNEARQVAWANGEAVSLLFRATELGGETGEVLNVCKKIERERRGWRGSRATVQDLADELADVVICADLLALTEGIDLDAAIVRKFNVTSEKVGLPHRLALHPSPTAEGVDPVQDEESVTPDRTGGAHPPTGAAPSDRLDPGVRARLESWAAHIERHRHLIVHNTDLRSALALIDRLSGRGA